MNAANFLTDNTGISTLKNKSLKMQLLDKQALQRNRNRLLFINIILPPLILAGSFFLLFAIRKRKYQ
jgi:hypothetical protein